MANQIDLIIVAQARDLLSAAMKAMGQSVSGVEGAASALSGSLGLLDGVLAGGAAGAGRMGGALGALAGEARGAGKALDAFADYEMLVAAEAEGGVAGVRKFIATLAALKAEVQSIKTLGPPEFRIGAATAGSADDQMARQFAAVKTIYGRDLAGEARAAEEYVNAQKILDPVLRANMDAEVAFANSIKEATAAEQAQINAFMQGEQNMRAARQLEMQEFRAVEADKLATIQEVDAESRRIGEAEAREQEALLQRRVRDTEVAAQQYISSRRAQEEIDRQLVEAEKARLLQVSELRRSLDTKAVQQARVTQERIQQMLAQPEIGRAGVLAGLGGRIKAGEASKDEAQIFRQLDTARLMETSKAAQAFGKTATSAFVTASTAVKGFRSSVDSAVNSLGGTTAVKLLGFFIIANKLREAVTQSLEFSRAMSQVGSIVDGTDAQVRGLGDDVRRLAREFGTKEVDVARGLYFTLSSGIDNAKDAVQLLTEANKLSVAGFADVETVIDLLTSTINAYGLKVSDARRLNDIFFATVKAGKAELPELAHNMGAVLPIASQVGVSLEELTSAIAALTLGGQNADEAITSIRQLLINLLNPTTNAQQIIGELQQRTDDFGQAGLLAAVKSKGLVNVMAALGRELGGNQVAMREIIPDARGMTAAFALSGNQLEAFQRILRDTQNSLGVVDEASAKVFAGTAKRAEIVGTAIRQGFLSLGDSIVSSMLPAGQTLDSVKSQADGIKASIEVWQAPLKAFTSLLAVAANGVTTLANGAVIQWKGLGAAVKSVQASITGDAEDRASAENLAAQVERRAFETARSIATLSGVQDGIAKRLSQEIKDRSEDAASGLEQATLAFARASIQLDRDTKARAEGSVPRVGEIIPVKSAEQLAKQRQEIEDLYVKISRNAGFLGIPEEVLANDIKGLVDVHDQIVTVDEALKMLDEPSRGEAFRSALEESLPLLKTYDDALRAAFDQGVISAEDDRALQARQRNLQGIANEYVNLAVVAARAAEIEAGAAKAAVGATDFIGPTVESADQKEERLKRTLELVKRESERGVTLDLARSLGIDDAFAKKVDESVVKIRDAKREFATFKAEADVGVLSGKFGAPGSQAASNEATASVAAQEQVMRAKILAAQRELERLSVASFFRSFAPVYKAAFDAASALSEAQKKEAAGLDMYKSALSGLSATQRDKLRADIEEVDVLRRKADLGIINGTIDRDNYEKTRNALALRKQQIEQELKLLDIQDQRQRAQSRLGFVRPFVEAGAQYLAKTAGPAFAPIAIDKVRDFLGQRRLNTAREELETTRKLYDSGLLSLDTAQALDPLRAAETEDLRIQLQLQRDINLEELAKRANIEDRERKNKQRGAAGGLAESVAQATDELGNFYEVGLRLGDAGLGHLTDAFTDIITHAKSAKDAFKDFALSVLRDIAQMIARFMALNAVAAIMGQPGVSFGGFLSSLFGGATGGATAPSSKGNVFEGGYIKRFALGGLPDVGSAPALFSMANGQRGSIREGGKSEAIMPLGRLPNGELGVKASGGGGRGGNTFHIPITINSQSLDPQAGAKAASTIAQQVVGEIKRGLAGYDRELVTAVRVAASSS